MPLTMTMTSDHFSSANFSIGHVRRVCYHDSGQEGILHATWAARRFLPPKASLGASPFDAVGMFSDRRNVLPNVLRSSQSFPER